jgi:short-subunit dehydrogenase
VINSSLRGRVVVVTGASSGIGKGTALALLRRGAEVVLAARRKDLLDEVVTQAGHAGLRAKAVEVDVSRPEDVERLARQALDTFGRIDAWINNASVGAVGRFEEIPVEDHRQLIETDLLGAIYGCHAALRHFRERGAGILVNVSSVLGRIPAPYNASYVAAKAGIRGLGAALRQELKLNGQRDIHVCTVLPMSTATPFFEHAARAQDRRPEPVPPVHDPGRVVETLLSLLTRPRDEVILGTAGKLSAAAHNIAPGWVESVMGRQTQRYQRERGPAASPGSGALHHPDPHGRGVRDPGLKH